MSVVFYISGHGFGHASREVEVINALGARCRESVIVRSAVSRDLLRRTLRSPFEQLDGPCDTGIIQASSITQDDEGTVRAALTFYETFDARVDREVETLAGRGVGLVVGDIPPLAFAVAARLGVPSVAIGNFTWDWIYQTHPGFLPDGGAAIERMRACYRQATIALELPFSGGFEIFKHVERLPLIARRATQPREVTRAFFDLPADRPLALLSFGGYGLPALDLTRVDCGGEWVIATTDRVSTSSARLPEYVRLIQETQFLDSPVRYEDLVAAADVVITKPGYGIISECVAGRTAMLYTSRGSFREYDVLVAALPAILRSAFISQQDLLAGRWQDALHAVLAAPPPPETRAVDGAERAADIIASLCEP
jgi:L-arabinokinase